VARLWLVYYFIATFLANFLILWLNQRPTANFLPSDPNVMEDLDRLDIHILDLLQDNAGLSNAELADRVGLSANACWRRTRRLEDRGIIRKKVALLSQEKLSLNVTVFVGIRTNQHNDKWLKQFADGVKAIPEVVEFYRMSGDIDYMLKIVVRDIADYDRVYKKLISVVPLHDVSSSFAMERIKSTTALPLH
jgi:Lrp/AsnC family transcriptional regulator